MEKQPEKIEDFRYKIYTMYEKYIGAIINYLTETLAVIAAPPSTSNPIIKIPRLRGSCLPTILPSRAGIQFLTDLFLTNSFSKLYQRWL